MTNPVPEGYGTVTPYLLLDDIHELVGFLEDLSPDELQRHRKEAGK